MKRYRVAQRIETVKIHNKNGKSFAGTVRKVRTKFGHHEPPSRSAIAKIIHFSKPDLLRTKKRLGILVLQDRP